MYAVIETGGKQYRVQEGDQISVEKLGVAAGEKVSFDKVLVMGEGADIQVGTPYLSAIVYGEVIEEGRGDKVIVYKYKAKKDYRRKRGHRQPFTLVEITGIGEDKPRKKAETKTDKPKKDETAKEEKQEASDTKEEPVEESATEDKGVSMSMKKDELIAYAEEHGIEIKKSGTKQEIIDAINEAK